MVFLLASCDKNEENPQQSESQTTLSPNETEDTEPTMNPIEVKASIVGTWAYNEIVTPQNFYGEHYNSEITKTNIKMRTTYMFYDNGAFSMGVSITNMDDVEREYKSLMVDGARKEAEAQGKYLSTDNVIYFENRAKQVLNDICKTENGTYAISGRKIIYTVNGNTTEETFTLNSNKLTVKGVKDNAYSITLTKQ